MFQIAILLVIIHLEDSNEAIILSKAGNPHWNTHKAKYGLVFEPLEDEKRFNIFMSNYKMIMEHNSKNSEYQLAMNHIGHLEKHEISRCLKRHKSLNLLKPQANTLDIIPVRDSIDYRDYGVVSRVKNQGSCGSCYAFSGIGSIESHVALQTGRLMEFSEEEIVDCSGNLGNQGCNGGLMENVFKYAIQNGISREEDYNYTAHANKCHTKNVNHLHSLVSYVSLKEGDEKDLIRTLSFIGPVSIAIDANHYQFMFYHSGILSIDNCSQSDLDHGVLAIGYQLARKQFLIVKNSWGTGWGENGYVRIALGSNMCGIASYGSYPIPLRNSK
uniref:Cathepsin L1 (Trinotate prediction) n=1 Tax=Henneguya salminicola TaxID=69463 RepID=A0A6G3MGQ9_HENSL